MPRMKQHQPHTSTNQIEAFTAAMWWRVCWLLSLLIQFPSAEGKRRMKRFVRHAERQVECILFLRAAAHLRRPPPRRRPLHAPNGFRRTCSNARLLMKAARVRLGHGGVFDRLVHLAEALLAPARYIARFTRRLRRGVRLCHFIPVAPPARGFATSAAPALPALADSS